MDATEPAHDPPVPKRPPSGFKRRLLKWGGAVVVLVVALVLVAPWIASPFIRSAIVRSVDDGIRGTARIEALTLSLTGRARVRGLSIDDTAGRRVVSLAELSARVRPLSLARGSVDASVEVSGLEVYVRKNEDGEWNLAELPKPGEPSSTPRDQGEGEPSPEGRPLPNVRLALRAHDCAVHFVAPGERVTTARLSLDATMTAVDGDSPFEMQVELSGPGAAAAKPITIHGHVVAAPGGTAGSVPTGRVEVAMPSVPLSVLEPLLALLTGTVAPGVAEGELAGPLVAELASAQAHAAPRLEAHGELTATDVRLADFEGLRAPLRFERAVLRITAEPDAARDRQELSLSIDDTLTGELTSTVDQTGDGLALEGKATVHGRVDGLFELARSFLELEPTVRLAGAFDSQADLNASLDERGLARAKLVATAKLSDLSGSGADGAPLPLDELAESRLALSADLDLAAGDLDVSNVDLRAGPVRIEGHGGVSGLPREGFDPSALRVSESRFDVSADLDRLASAVSGLTPDGVSFGGRIDGFVRADQDGPRIRVATELHAAKLAFAVAEGTAEASSGETKIGPLDVELRESLTIDPSPGGRSVLDTLSVRSDVLDLDASGSATDLLSAERAEGSLTNQVRVKTAKLGELLAGVAGVRLEGEDVEHRLTLALHGRDVDVESSAALPRIVVHATGPEPGAVEVGGAEAKLQGRFVAGRGELALDASVAELRALDEGAEEPGASAPELRALTLRAPRIVVESEAGRVAVETFELAAATAGLSLKGSFSSERPVDGAGASEERFESELALDPEPLGELLQPFLVSRLGGEPLKARLTLSMKDDAVDVRCDATGPLLSSSTPPTSGEGPPRTIVQRDFELAVDVGGPPEDLNVRMLRYASRSMRLEGSGRIQHAEDPTKRSVELDLRSTADLAPVIEELGLGADLPPGYRVAGKLESTATVRGTGPRLDVGAQAAVNDFEALVPASAEKGARPRTVHDSRITLALDAGLVSPALDLDLRRLGVDGRFLRGSARGTFKNLGTFAASATEDPDAHEAGLERATIEGFEGTFRYIPDDLGALLAPWLPGDLSGAEEEELTFRFDGTFADVDTLSVLRALNGGANLGLGRFVTGGFDTRGGIRVESKGESLTAHGSLAANGGTLELGGQLDLREPGAAGAEPPRSRLTCRLEGVQTNAKLGPLLSNVHPIFAATRGTLAGTMLASLELEYDAPIDAEVLEAGWDALPKEPISGKGRLDLRALSIDGSPLLSQLLQLVGQGDGHDLALDPVVFEIRNGRLVYEKPWQWTIGGSKTTFSGTIGLDHTLDLAWNVPVTESLVRRYPFLTELKDSDIRIPIGGTVERPRPDVDGALASLARAAAEKEVRERVGGGLGDLLGLDKEESARKLLQEADDLYKKGEREEAKALYTKIRQDFHSTLTYRLAKDRIRKRSGG